MKKITAFYTQHNKLVYILLLATLLRVFGIWHDYPYSFYPDEAHFVKRALSFGSFDFNPHWFHKPAFYMYLLFFEYGLLFLVGKIIGLWASVSDFAVSYIINPGPFYLLGRLTTTFFGIATISLVYKAGEKHFTKNTGVWGSILLSLSYAHVASCQDIKADVPASFFAILSMYFLLNYLEEYPRKSALIWASATAGIGAATKVYPMVMLAPIFLAFSWGTTHTITDQSFKRIVLLSFIVLFTFWGFYFICSPYSFIDPLGRKAVFDKVFRFIEKCSTFLGSETVARPDKFIAEQTSAFNGFINYYKTLFGIKGIGYFTGITGTLGALTLVLSKRKKYLIFLIFPFIFITLSAWTFPGYAEPRHQLPIYPFFTLAAGFLCAWLTDRFPSHRKIIYVLMLLGLSIPFSAIIQRGFHISKTDTRNIAKNWIEQNIPVGSKIIFDENGPPLIQVKDTILHELQKSKNADQIGQFTAHYDTYVTYQLLAADKSITYDLTEIRFPWWRDSEEKEGVHELTSEYDRDMANPLKAVGVHPYQYYADNSYQYAIVHSDKYEAYFKSHSNQARNFPSFARFYKELFANGKLIKEFSPQDGNRPGPTVKIFKLKNTT